MQDGCSVEHKHRYLRVKHRGLLKRALSLPVWTTCDIEQARRSRYAYSTVQYTPPGWDFIAYEYVLTLRGFLHGLVGLTLVTDEEGEQ